MGNIPTLEEVKEYFKNVDTVETKTVKEKRKINHKKIWVDRDGDVWSEEKDTGYKFFLYDTNYKYAKILTHKEPNYTITKEQLLELENGFTLPKLKEWFPDVFEVKLEVRKWYKGTYTDNTNPINKSIIFIDSLDGNKVNGYGFNYEGLWFDKKYNCGTVGGHWSLASEQEVFEALKNEAVKRGFKEDVYILSLKNKYKYKTIDNIFYYDLEDNILSIGGYNIFNNGQWAEIIQILTKKEAEEKLNCKII